VGRDGYAITPAGRTEHVFYAEPATFTGLAADGASGSVTTTKLTLSFDKDIEDLSAADITLTAGSTGATKGVLTKISGTGRYELTLPGISAAGEITVNASKPGYAISGGPRSVQIHINTVAYNGLTQNGNLSKTTNMLTLTFNKDIAGLSAADITISSAPGNAGIVKGTLARVRTGEYNLPLSGVSEFGEISVSVAKAAFLINPASRNTEVYYAIPAAYTGLSANDTATEPVTKLTLAFDQDITGLTADNITLSGGSGVTVTKGEHFAKVANSTGVYEIGLSVVSTSTSTSGVTITAQILPQKEGYEITPASRSVTVRNLRSFNSLTANGSLTSSTDALTLTFNSAVPGLTIGDIIIDAGGTGAVKGSLSSSGSTYTLRLLANSISASGEITVSINSANLTITPASRNVNVYYAIPVAFNLMTHNGTLRSTTNKLTLTFSNDIFGLSAADITLTPGSTGAVKGNLNKTGTGLYELELTGITQQGQVTAAVNKAGYSVSPASRNLTVNYAAPRVFTGLSADGSAGVQSTANLTLIFDSPIASPNLAAADIILNPGTTGAVKGALTRVESTSSYNLALSGIIRSGQVEINAAKDGFDISGGPKTVEVFAVGSAPIIISFDQIIDNAPVIAGPTLYRVSNNGPTSAVLSLEDSGQYDPGSISWRIQGNTVLPEPDGNLKLNAGDYLIGEYFVMLAVKKGGAPYNKTISFRVEY